MNGYLNHETLIPVRVLGYVERDLCVQFVEDNVFGKTSELAFFPFGSVIPEQNLVERMFWGRVCNFVSDEPKEWWIERVPSAKHLDIDRKKAGDQNVMFLGRHQEV